MAEYGVRLERKGKVALIIFDRPERRNAFNEVMWSGLEQTVKELKKHLPRVVVVTGSGKAFCAGFDVNPDNPQISGLIASLQKMDLPPIETLIKRLQSAVNDLVTLPVPVIAAINGDAYGGGAELASRCDLRVMDEQAVICFAEVKLGLIPDWGGGPGLTRLIGASRAADMILTGRKVEANEALRIGLVNRISTPGMAMDEAMAMAEIIAQNGPRAVRHALAVIRQVHDLTMKQALELECQESVSLIISGECIHGITAFLSKKPPEFPDI
ncbi:MAG TPA: enoyl-CoA hydratase/isomerase family protein [Syntrophales bacterium]|nr:enoyl-CoA hydratase/isomerase family protein [Syntrophales bacterium]